ncbi:hypothetical protein [Fimbriimonas ginsengisoli]|uniref:Uncharacterized protein n=1 Tax=Fimbriimonas ginsengisoli Gsoil 348 TaxID=661478 RepID=A0A068NK84_FIMGI|nr:hypothetical protein [Fimbriimonas ginsengisoli]AIE83862.1 hypothetical protein OP10G_0494 [Fimbriimonas ginsengisoli Gsoil 348]
MSKWKEGDRVRVVSRPVTDEDRKKNRYYDHMVGLVGTIQNVYEHNEVAVRVDPDSMTPVTKQVHEQANQRMRDRFQRDTSEEQKKQLTKEEMEFTANYVVLVQGTDLEKA